MHRLRVLEKLVDFKYSKFLQMTDFAEDLYTILDGKQK